MSLGARGVSLAAAAVGLAISAYLTVLHYQGAAPLCSTGAVVDCTAVTSSAYSVLGDTGIPVTVLGLAWFGVSGLLTVLSVARGDREPGWLPVAHLAWAGAGMAFVLYLVWAELVPLHRICEWCTAVHLLVFTTFLAALWRVQRREPWDDAVLAPRGARLASEDE